MKFKLVEENELEKRAKEHRKKQKGMSPFHYLKPNAGNVELNIDRFNHSVADNTGSTSGDGGGMGESVVGGSFGGQPINFNASPGYEKYVSPADAKLIGKKIKVIDPNESRLYGKVLTITDAETGSNTYIDCKLPNGEIRYNYDRDKDVLFKLVESLNEESNKLNKITIRVYVEPVVNEALPSGNKNDKYDDQTLEEWYDFAATIEGIIEQHGDVVNINLSKHDDSLSEYIDFYILDADGNKQDGLIDLRLSDHKQTSNGRQVRKKNAEKIDTTYQLKGIIVNDKTFKSYDAAIQYLRNMFNMV